MLLWGRLLFDENAAQCFSIPVSIEGVVGSIRPDIDGYPVVLVEVVCTVPYSILFLFFFFSSLFRLDFTAPVDWA